MRRLKPLKRGKTSVSHPLVTVALTNEEITFSKKKNQPHDALNCLVLPRSSLSVVTAMSCRNVIRHYMRSDSGSRRV